MIHWKIYYRGSLSSCNYACGYCPFAKTSNSRQELLEDQKEVERFTEWIAGRSNETISLLFTPWGEALGHRYYREALVRLSRLEQVRRVSIQTNLSAPLERFSEADSRALTFWATYHPGQTSRERFLSRCRQLDRMNLRYSVGIVGVREHLQEMVKLRRELSPEVYLWVNAYKRKSDYYRPEELETIRSVDPLFDLNNQRYPSLGEDCAAGSTHFTVDGHGAVRRCHFVGEVMGNIYTGEPHSFLVPRACPNQTCGCYIGYIHLPHLKLEELYGEDLLGRIPSSSRIRRSPACF